MSWDDLESDVVDHNNALYFSINPITNCEDQSDDLTSKRGEIILKFLPASHARRTIESDLSQTIFACKVVDGLSEKRVRGSTFIHQQDFEIILVWIRWIVR